MAIDDVEVDSRRHYLSLLRVVVNMKLCRLTLLLCSLLLLVPMFALTVKQVTAADDLSGTWGGIVEGQWTDTYYYPVDIIGGGISQITFSYTIRFLVDVKDDDTFSGTAQFKLEQPIWTAEITAVPDNGNT